MKTQTVRYFTVLALLAAAIAAMLTFSPAAALAASSGPSQLQAPAADQYGCYYAARYVADVTVPDNTRLAPGTPFTKVWRIRNEGNCAFGPGLPVHNLVFAGGTNLAQTFSFALTATARPGEQIDIAIPMAAAIYDGQYISQWKLQGPDGRQIGFGSSGQAALYVKIIVSSGQNSGSCGYYTVRWGDYLRLIAARYGVSWQALAQANGLHSPYWLYAGMRLVIPCGEGSTGGPTSSFASPSHGFSVRVPAGWSVNVNRSVPSEYDPAPEYVTFSSPGGGLPKIEIHVMNGTPPFTGFENCTRNLIFRGYAACSFGRPAGQQPAQRFLILQRGDAHFYIAMSYENSSALETWDSFLSSFQFD
ncbi:MAG: NBR1-Ig-like domain-containing protein [Rudaea sp.]